MRRLRVIICLVFIVSCVVFAAYTVKSRIVEDHKAPVITCDEDTIKVSVKEEDINAALLKGIKAKDNRDGDLTKSVRVASLSHFIKGTKRTVSYVVFDKANQVGTLERTVEYEDYTPPRIHMTKPMRFSVLEMEKVNLEENLTAEDCLDGDITSQIRTNLESTFAYSQAGTYDVTIQVSNSAGDVCAIPVEITVLDNTDRQESYKEYPVLSEYIAYTEVGKEIKPKDYLIGIEKSGTEYSFKEDKDMLTATKDDVKVESKVDYSKPGVYTVEYSYKAEGASKGVTKLFVVVEGEEDGEE